jgi:hypothetical protein
MTTLKFMKQIQLQNEKQKFVMGKTISRIQKLELQHIEVEYTSSTELIQNSTSKYIKQKIQIYVQIKIMILWKIMDFLQSLQN